MSALAGCNQSYSQGMQPSPAPKLRVVTTFLPMSWFTKAVVGEEVEILIPPGTKHDYQAMPANVSAIATANVLVKNGIDFEQFLDGTTKSAQNFH
ncbi:metal ABC transporter solute-binding protein, Zn/Mn family [Chlorogloea sp. CCALA 695]|uniref:metal ABC transporter solute-binding protein, Zn/Mn family n=1 Tax=Chlorogloea sp. CCALA 695 TaxID=2107693 RepID=UPI001E5CB55C|nr:zinc ABC transporter substrate-binding protein [Chlorogloea sp. CCALA 695]